MVFSTLARSGIAALTAVLTLSLSACGLAEVPSNPESRGISVTIGSRGTVESGVLAQLYGQALELDGFDVDYNLGISSRKAQFLALEEGLIDVIPEYSGSLVKFLDPVSLLKSTDSMVARLPDLLEKKKLEVLEPSKAGGSPAFIVTKKFAREHNLVTIADLTSIAGTLTLGAEKGFEEQSYGLAGLERVYGIQGWEYKEFEEGDDPRLVAALLDEKVDVANIPASSPAIVSDDLVVLTDPSVLITQQNVIPLVRSEIASDELTAVINAVSTAVTTEDLRELRAASRGDSPTSAETLAREWLEEHGFDD